MHQMPADRHEEPKPGGCWPVLLMVVCMWILIAFILIGIATVFGWVTS